MQYVTEVFDRVGELERLQGFVADFGRKFYRIEKDLKEGTIVMVKDGFVVEDMIGSGDNVVPFRAGETLMWDALWIES